MKKVQRPWSEADNNTIRGLAGLVPLKESARQLNRTEGATGVQASKLRVSVKFVGRSKKPTIQKPVETNEASALESVIGPAVIERALTIYQQLHDRDQSVVLQARKILTQHIFGMIDQGECDEQRLLVGGLVRLKAIERDHDIKSAHESSDRRENAG